MRNFVLVFLLLASHAFAANTYYIDFATGSDANNGTAKGTPWQHAPGMAIFTASYSHSAGDHFIFKGGVTWGSTCLPFHITNGGSSAGNRDYYGVDQTWFTGGSWTRPVIDAGYVAATTHRVQVDGSYVQLDNLEIKHLSASNIATSPGLLTTNSGTVGNLITNCWIHGWITTVAADDAFGGVIVGTSNPPLDFTLDNTEVENSENKNVLTFGTSSTSFVIGTGSKTFTTTGVLTVLNGQYVQVHTNSDPTRYMGGYVTSVTGSPATSVTINVTTTNDPSGGASHSDWTLSGPYTSSGLAVRCVAIIQNGSKIHDNSSAVLYCLDFNGSSLYNVTGDGFDGKYHYNGIYQDPFAWTQPNSIRTAYIRNSYLHDVYLGANMAYPNIRGGATCMMYNNVLYGAMSSQLAVEIDPFQYASEGVGNFTGYNNTIANFNGASVVFNVVSRATPMGTLTLFNNHVINASAITNGSVPSTVTTYNNGTNLSQTSATTTAQGYVLGNLYAPTLGGSTIDVGTSESGTFTTDILGTSRPQNAIWDIGAYEFIPGTPTPTLISASVNTGGNQLTLNLSTSCTTGTGGSGGVTVTPSGGASTATYLSGSGSASYIYSLSRTILSGETVTTSYTQPGNGIEATTGGNDLASYGGTSVTNNSTQTGGGGGGGSLGGNLILGGTSVKN